jgi:16S rRNA (cytosine1402-N4)-methyltransferase
MKKRNSRFERLEKSGAYHVPIMTSEVLSGLRIKPGGIYVDCTLGGAGHTRAILGQLGEEGRLYAFDQDVDATRNLPVDERIVFVGQNFRHLQRFLRLYEVFAVDGIVADLGVSSHQFDEAGRGFSIRLDGPLDMRMNQQQSLSAAEIINYYDEKNLHRIFEQYGQVTNAKTLARKIVEERKKATVRTTSDLTSLLDSVSKGNPNKYAAQVFQSLRIEVNDELNALKDMLRDAVGILKPGGRIVIITFHSLEDKIVKNFFKYGGRDDSVDDADPFGVRARSPLRMVTKKPIEPSEAELNSNPRARSAKLRIAEKL